jgi:uncharacterized membrane protein
MITDPTLLFIYLAALLGAVLWLGGLPRLQGFFRILPPILFVYFLPGVGSGLGVTPLTSPLYTWLVRYLLPFSLFLLMMTVDVRAIFRLGARSMGMMLAGTLGIIIGAPISFAIMKSWLPPDAWKGLAALSGSWIGGSANLVAMAQSVGMPESLYGPIIVVDTGVGYTWMGVLLFFSTWQARFDAKIGARRAELDALGERLAVAEAQRVPADTRDLAMILGLGFVAAALCLWAGDRLPPLGNPTIISHTTWTVCIATTLGLALSFTPLSRLERVGASKVGFLALYLMLTAIGAQADLSSVLKVPAFLVVGVIWIAIHIAVMLGIAILTRSPLFFVATGSMANIGGVISAPVVASVYHRSLAPVGVLMGVSGYILGIYGAIICAWLLAWVAK